MTEHREGRIMRRILSFTLVLLLALTVLTGCGLLSGSGIVCNVNFYVDGQIYMKKQVEMGSAVPMPNAPEKAGELFLGWYTDGFFTAEYDFSRPVLYDIDLYAFYTRDAVALTNKVTNEAVKSLVTIKTKCFNTGPFGVETTSFSAQGSGVIIDISGGWAYALTNCHVIAQEDGYKYREITVDDAYGNTFPADIYKNKQLTFEAVSEDYDLALVCFKYTEGMLAEIGIGNDPMPGDNVVSLGAPDGQRNSITYGQVQGYNKINAEDGDDISKVAFEIIIHNAPIDHGSSGGPLLDTECKLIGLNFAGYNNGQYGCAIPMSKINEFLSKFVYNN